MFRGSIVALVTPFLESGEIDFESVQRLIRMHLLEKTDGIVVGGTTGEGPTLEEEEFSLLLEFVIKEVNGKIPVIAGTGSNSTKKTVRLTALAKEAGADGAMIIVPYYNKPTDRGVLAHFREVNNVRLPLIVYHHPGRCGIELDAETLIELLRYEFIVGLKDCSKNNSALREVLERVPNAIILSGEDERAIQMIQMGAKGVISVIGNLLPLYWNNLIHTALSGNFVKAEEEYLAIKSLVWAISLEVNPQGIKCALAKEGFCKNVLRLPLVTVTKDTEEEIYESLEETRTFFNSTLERKFARSGESSPSIIF
jgi:4-hydroxy-tetrahydrodipicolinate synthase